MGRHDDVLGQLLQPRTVVGEHIESVGIHHDGGLRTAYLRDEGDGGVLLLTESGSDGHGIDVLAVHGLGEVFLVVVGIDDGFGDADLQDVVVAAGCAYHHFPDA